MSTILTTPLAFLMFAESRIRLHHRFPNGEEVCWFGSGELTLEPAAHQNLRESPTDPSYFLIQIDVLPVFDAVSPFLVMKKKLAWVNHVLPQLGLNDPIKIRHLEEVRVKFKTDDDVFAYVVNNCFAGRIAFYKHAAQRILADDSIKRLTEGQKASVVAGTILGSIQERLNREHNLQCTQADFDRVMAAFIDNKFESVSEGLFPKVLLFVWRPTTS